MPTQQHILRINCRTHEVRTEVLPTDKVLWGGRRLTTHLICAEVPPLCHPLGPNNSLYIACGPLAGTLTSSVNRLSIGAKSPLTGGIKESNAGGTSAYAMGILGIRAIALHDCPPKVDTQYILHISKAGVRFDELDSWRGVGVFARAEQLFARYGKHVAMSLIGPVGDMLLHSAGITNTDPEGVPSRYNGRGGLGAVMGSKGIAAIVYDTTGVKRPRPVDKATYVAQNKALSKTVLELPFIDTYRQYGTAAMMDITQSLGALPTRNFSLGKFDHKDTINATCLHKTILQRGGEGRISHACMKGCLIQCSNVYADATGKAVCSPVEYENLGLLGSNLCIGNLDHVARLNFLCNDLGCDTIEMGAALGVAMAANVLPFGDFAAASAALEEVRQGTAFGRVLASGAVTVGKVYGCRHVPAVKNQGMPAYDPRSLKGLGVCYATSSQGADHTAGNVVRAPLEHHKKDGQVAAVKNSNINAMILDSLGFCLILGAAIKSWDDMCTLITAHTGQAINHAQLVDGAKESLRQERAFNAKAGLGPEHDVLPEYMYLEENPDSGVAFDFEASELAAVSQDSCPS